MSTYHLDKVFSPRSIAVVGASPRAASPGHAVHRNLRCGGFAGRVDLVNPHYDAIAQVTVMFSDLVGSTALSARMDPEDLREVIDGYEECSGR
jgi:class 3 adenylate cyclase